MLQPHHFLPDNSLLSLYLRQQERVAGLKHYKMAADRMLREQTGDDTSQRFPPFRFIGTRTQVGHAINPLLVILAAEIKFRRYLAVDGPQLPPVYDSLMQKTIQVAELLYFLPADGESAFHDHDMQAFHTPVHFVDAEMGCADESGGSTAQQQGRTATGHADADYWRHMLSGRGIRFHIFIVGFLTDCKYPPVDLELNNDDLDVLHEIQESNRGKQRSQLGVDSSLTHHSRLQSWSIS